MQDRVVGVADVSGVCADYGSVPELQEIHSEDRQVWYEVWYRQSDTPKGMVNFLYHQDHFGTGADFVAFQAGRTPSTR